VNVNKEKLNTHEFNIGQLFGSVARSIGKKLGSFNPFALSSGSSGFNKQTTSTTTESFDFGPDEDFKSESSSTTEGFDFDLSTEEKNEISSTEAATKKSSGGYSYDVQKYLPPQTSPKSNYLPPSTVYLPPKTIKRQ
jgi:hypothetical protein